MKTTLDHVCLNMEEIERIVLEENHGRDVATRVQIEACDRCRQRFYEARVFHNILNDELRKPVSPRILKLVQTL